MGKIGAFQNYTLKCRKIPTHVHRLSFFSSSQNISSSDKSICLVSRSPLLSSQHKIKHKEFSLQRQTFALTIGLSWQIILPFLSLSSPNLHSVRVSNRKRGATLRRHKDQQLQLELRKSIVDSCIDYPEHTRVSLRSGGTSFPRCSTT